MEPGENLEEEDHERGEKATEKSSLGRDRCCRLLSPNSQNIVLRRLEF